MNSPTSTRHRFLGSSRQYAPFAVTPTSPTRRPRKRSPAFDRTLWALCGSYSGAGSQPKLYVRSFDGEDSWERPRSGFYGGYSSKLQAVSEQVAWAAGVRYPLTATRNGGGRRRIVLSRHDDGGWIDVTFVDAKHGWAALVIWF